MKAISAEQLNAFLERDPATLVLDVRFAHEREEVGYLVNSRHVSWYGDDWEVNPRFLTDVAQISAPQRPMVILCRSGHRSAEACALLESHGYTQVFNLECGFNGLTLSPVPSLGTRLARWLALPQSFAAVAAG